LDARTLARIAQIGPELLSAAKHGSAQAQVHRTEIQAAYCQRMAIGVVILTLWAMAD
jgi:hypothetical protein